jgi:hypothetical protein
MARSRRAELTLGACSAVLLVGLAGLAWWLWRHRRGHEPRVARWRRTRVALVALGLLVIAVGATWRLVTAVRPVPECSLPAGPLPTTPLNAWVVAQKAATWAETGVGMLYSQADGARLCFSRVANYYVAENSQHIAGARAVAIGDVVLKPELDIPKENMLALVEHEARHRTQWAVGTVLGGPLAFPIAYGIAEFFFPEERNPFERMAGLEAGGYTASGTGPALGPAQLAVLSALAAIIVAAFVVRYRRAAAKARHPRRPRA